MKVSGSEGNYLVSQEGRKFIDLIAGWCVVNAGYGREEIISRMAEHAEQAAYVKTSYIDERTVQLAERLAQLAPGNLRQTFRVPSGTEAVEISIKAARLYTGKDTIISNELAYHGTAYGAMSAGYDELGQPFTPLDPGFDRVPVPDFTDAWYDEFAERMSKGDVAAYLSETVLTHQGVVIPPNDHYERVSEICNANDALLILDEVANGFGRTGKMFAADHYGVTPDIMALAKGMSSGYAPAGGAIMAPDIGEEMSTTKMSAYSTFGWVPAAVGAVQANIDILQDEGLSTGQENLGDTLEEELIRIDGVREVRRKGLLVGVVLEDSTAADARAAASQNGVLAGTTNDGRVLLLAPPLNVEEAYVAEGIQRLENAIEVR